MRKYVKETFPEQERAPDSPSARSAADRRTRGRPRRRPSARRGAATLRSFKAAPSRHALAERGIATTLLGVTTTGDRDQQTPIDRLGEVNVFVKELENALRERRADYAVHSAKDLAASLADDLRIAAISRREDARDAFCSERYPDFESLPPGAGRRNLEPSPAGAARGTPSGPAIRVAARKRRHAAAQARRRRIRCDRACHGGIEPPGCAREARRAVYGRVRRSGGRARRTRDRNARGRRAAFASALREAVNDRRERAVRHLRARGVADDARGLQRAARRSRIPCGRNYGR